MIHIHTLVEECKLIQGELYNDRFMLYYIDILNGYPMNNNYRIHTIWYPNTLDYDINDLLNELDKTIQLSHYGITYEYTIKSRVITGHVNEMFIELVVSYKCITED